MQESLGISINNQVIKYAKLIKNNNQIDVASFGIKFYDNLEKNIQQIIDETNSNNVPICINTKDEKVSLCSPCPPGIPGVGHGAGGGSPVAVAEVGVGVQHGRIAETGIASLLHEPPGE